VSRARRTAAAEQHVADSHDMIRVHGARENNLKNVDVELPKRRLTVFTGVSGSGKSSLVFDTIAADSRSSRVSCRRWRGPTSTCSTA
jgi:ABC-type transport system involved in cytochrome bd biosynthesis fused ATPase/permease subunit